MINEFEALGQQCTSETASDGSVLRYEQSATGIGAESTVKVDGRWVYCPSHELMHPQKSIDGFERGARALWQGHPCTVLSVYRVEGLARACVVVDDRGAEDDRQGMPLSALTRA